MIDVEHEVVETYFESNGFLVRLAGRSTEEVSKRKISPLATMAVYNPLVIRNSEDLSFRLFTSDLGKVKSAMVSRLSWESTSFSISILNSDSRILKFIKQEASPERFSIGFNPAPGLAESRMGDYLRLLVVPALPGNQEKVNEVFTFLRECGVDGVLTLSSMLENLLRQTNSSFDYKGKGVFHLLKLLKVYQLAREPQLDIFEE